MRETCFKQAYKSSYMPEERFQCPECEKYFGSGETLREHARLEHSKTVQIVDESGRIGGFSKAFNPYLNKSLAIGLLLGIVISTTAFSGYTYWDSLDHRTPVPITVVTCENCSYSKFENATDRMFNAHYEEVNYQSSQGQQLINKYDINYVPAFIFDKKAEKAGDFYKVKPILVEFKDAYVIPDRGDLVAQRYSEGIKLE